MTAVQGATRPHPTTPGTTAPTPGTPGTLASPPPPHRLDDVKGWFPPLDQLLFDWFLHRQEAGGLRGDLLEVGVFMGKSAIFLGRHRQEGERYTVCDLFGGDAPDGANRAESVKSYSSLSRRAFESNYLAFHDELPRVLQGPSSLVPGEVAPASCRFVHIDGSHLYEHVHGDIGAARDVLLPDGIVVLDDFRSEHTPGVSVAAWEAVLSRGLHPICLTTQKLYGTWGDPEPAQDALLEMVRAREDCDLSIQQAAGHRLIRLKSRPALTAPSFPPSRHPEPEPAPPAETLPRQRNPAPTPHHRARRLAHDLLPPLVTRAIRRARTPRAPRREPLTPPQNTSRGT
ncbi:class I SAM-dependent methyltransferase [Streptomyces sp. NPDC056716]|uniref:class I SAM-dependent methyltransferase n=1 Tax=unclassified Streptomyces TaxID=2593676 RepID=UPI003688E62A